MARKLDNEIIALITTNPVESMKLLSLIFMIVVLTSCTDGGSDIQTDDLAMVRMSDHQHSQLNHYLDNNYCTCGCGMLISQCLRDDPTCEVSPELARAAIEIVADGPSSPVISNDAGYRQENSGQYSTEKNSEPTYQKTYMESSGTGSVTQGRLNGQNCTFVSVGGTTMKSCD